MPDNEGYIKCIDCGKWYVGDLHINCGHRIKNKEEPMIRIEKLMAVAEEQKKTVIGNREKEAKLYAILVGDGVGTDKEFHFLMPKPWWKFWASRREIIISLRSERDLLIGEASQDHHCFSNFLHDDCKLEVIDYLLSKPINGWEVKAIETSMARFV